MAWSAQNEADVLEQLFKVEQDFGAVGTGEAGMHASRNGWVLIEIRDQITGSVTYGENGTGGPHPADYNTPIAFDENVELSRNIRARTAAALGASEFGVFDSPSNRYQHVLLSSANYASYNPRKESATNGDGAVYYTTVGQPDLSVRLRSTNYMFDVLGLPSGAAQAGTGIYSLSGGTHKANEGDLFLTAVPAGWTYDYGTTADPDALAHARSALEAPFIPNDPGTVYPDTVFVVLPSIARPYDDGVVEAGVQQTGVWARTRNWDPIAAKWIDGTPASLIIAGAAYSGQYTINVSRTLTATITGG